MLPTTAGHRSAPQASEEVIREAERQALRHNLSFLVCVMHRDIMAVMDKRTTPHGVSSSQWRFLRALYVKEGVTQRELSESIGIREPSTVRALARLEREGLVERRVKPDDRRAISVFLTPKARALVKDLLPYVDEVNALALAGLTPAEEQMLKSLAIKVVRNLAVA